MIECFLRDPASFSALDSQLEFVTICSALSPNSRVAGSSLTWNWAWRALGGIEFGYTVMLPKLTTIAGMSPYPSAGLMRTARRHIVV